jgi:hypothetical protein
MGRTRSVAPERYLRAPVFEKTANIVAESGKVLTLFSTCIIDTPKRFTTGNPPLTNMQLSVDEA